MSGAGQDGEVVRGYSLGQVCVICGATSDLVSAMVAFGILDPSGDRPESWRFGPQAIRRAEKAMRLQRDLGPGLQCLALCLDLLDEIDRLRAGRAATDA